MPPISFNGRVGTAIENNFLRVTVLQQGGHIAEIFDKQAQISPLWVPRWHSIEPSTYDVARHREFGVGSDSKLLAAIMGHNLCLDIFGGPSTEEAKAGITAHGEASVERYEITETTDHEIVMRSRLSLAQLLFERHIELHGRCVRVRESIENLAAFDRPIAWTQHVTLGPPFLDAKTTQFAASVTESMASATDPGLDGYLKRGTVFDWPVAPRADGGMADLRQMSGAAAASEYTAHLTDPQCEHAFFIAYTQKFHLEFGYIWKRSDFPWLGIWEENCSRQHSPWSGNAITRGMEFGVSPFPESRREMVERGPLFETPTYRWLPAKATLETEYWILAQSTDRISEFLLWPKGS